MIDVRLIDADAFKEYIRGACEEMSHVYKDGGKWAKQITEDFCMDIDEQPTIEPQQWIPCSERLPEKDTCFYLATIANHGLNFTTTLPDDVDVVRWDYDRRKGYNSWHWCTERTVIAWMPLPEVFKEATE